VANEEQATVHPESAELVDRLDAAFSRANTDLVNVSCRPVLRAQ
jgi:hypothetical protein